MEEKGRTPERGARVSHDGAAHPPILLYAFFKRSIKINLREPSRGCWRKWLMNGLQLVSGRWMGGWGCCFRTTQILAIAILLRCKFVIRTSLIS